MHVHCWEPKVPEICQPCSFKSQLNAGGSRCAPSANNEQYKNPSIRTSATGTRVRQPGAVRVSLSTGSTSTHYLFTSEITTSGTCTHPSTPGQIVTSLCSVTPDTRFSKHSVTMVISEQQIIGSLLGSKPANPCVAFHCAWNMFSMR